MTNIFTLKMLLEQIYLILGVEHRLQGSRTPIATDARRIFVQIALENRYKPNEIAKALQQDRTTLYFLKRTFKDYIVYDPAFKERFEIVSKNIKL